jgi:hypothetical protein
MYQAACHFGLITKVSGDAVKSNSISQTNVWHGEGLVLFVSVLVCI